VDIRLTLRHSKSNKTVKKPSLRLVVVFSNPVSQASDMPSRRAILVMEDGKKKVETVVGRAAVAVGVVKGVMFRLGAPKGVAIGAEIAVVLELFLT